MIFPKLSALFGVDALPGEGWKFRALKATSGSVSFPLTKLKKHRLHSEGRYDTRFVLQPVPRQERATLRRL